MERPRDLRTIPHDGPISNRVGVHETFIACDMQRCGLWTVDIYESSYKILLGFYLGPSKKIQVLPTIAYL